MSDDKKPDPKKEEPDFTVITPPNLLAAKVPKKTGTLDDLLKNADKMLTSIQFEFESLMDQAIADLQKHFKESWTDPAKRPKAVSEFSGIANTIKGQSGSFNYGLLGDIADLFRDYLDDTNPEDQNPAAILSYINAIQVVWKQKITGDGGMIGKQIVSDLIKLNQKAAGGPR
jgi:hypothetical protein